MIFIDSFKGWWKRGGGRCEERVEVEMEMGDGKELEGVWMRNLRQELEKEPVEGA